MKSRAQRIVASLSHAAVAAARNTASAICVIAIVLPWSWGVLYGVFEFERISTDLALLWFLSAMAVLTVAAGFYFASMLVQPARDKAVLTSAGLVCVRFAAWILVAAMLEWFATHAFEIYERQAPVPIWVDRVADVAEWLAPAPFGIAVWRLVWSPYVQNASPQNRSLQTNLPCPANPARN